MHGRVPRVAGGADDPMVVVGGRCGTAAASAGARMAGMAVPSQLPRFSCLTTVGVGWDARAPLQLHQGLPWRCSLRARRGAVAMQVREVQPLVVLVRPVALGRNNQHRPGRQHDRLLAAGRRIMLVLVLVLQAEGLARPWPGAGWAAGGQQEARFGGPRATRVGWCCWRCWS